MRVRGFEIVTKYKDKGINTPIRKTKLSGGYDFESAETVVVPSLWKQIFDFMSMADIETDYGGYDAIVELVKEQLKTKSLKALIKEYNLRPTLVSTGIKAYMLDDEYLQLSNRSSGALNRGIVMSNGIGIIDADYYNNLDNEGEIFFQFLNFLPFDVTINKHEAIGQGIFKKYLLADEDVATGSRGGGFGSTDEKNSSISRHLFSTTEELEDKLRLLENNSAIQDINRSQYIDILNELYNRSPHIYFRKWYFFKTWTQSTFKEWEEWSNLCVNLDEKVERIDEYGGY